MSRKIFISYSWDSEEHQQWVRKLADSLEEIFEIDVKWDGYDLDSLIDKNLFMESGIYDSDLVLVVTTQKYKKKADERQGGVGIETFLATANHWDEILNNKRTKFVEIRRERNSTPRYLNGHFYLDFVNDDDFGQNFQKLLTLIRGDARVARPKKTVSLTQAGHSYSFSRIEDIVAIKNSNRTAIVSASEGVDFSRNNKIKYELWETRSPAVDYFLALSPNINIAQTVQHAVKKLQDAKIRPANITVLRQRSARPEQDLIAGIFATNSFSTTVYECTYKEYIWDYCIDPALKRIDPPVVIANYTDQDLEFTDLSTGEKVTRDSALKYFIDVLPKQSTSAAHLVIAPGGMGKTSLCLSIAKQLHNRNDLRSSVVLIQAESIRKYIAEKGAILSRIESIYDIYELYAKYQGHTRIFERATFDLAVVCGNLVIIIDGLDELSSLFREKFDINGFLESLKKLHDELGSSNILLTTRNNVVNESDLLERLDISTYELLGFDPEDSKRYLRKRFANYDNAEALVEKVKLQIEKIRLIDPDNRVVPFFADVVSTVVEDELKEQHGQDFDLDIDSTPYPTNNELTDHVIHSILRREDTRHGLEISKIEIVQFISNLVVDFGKRWRSDEMLERLQMIYESRASDLYSKIALNPLLLKVGDDFELRYSFLSSYFEVLFLISGITNASLESELIRTLAKLLIESEEGRDVKKYFHSHRLELSTGLSKLIPELRIRAAPNNTKVTPLEKETAKKAISTGLGLYAAVMDTTQEKLTAEILQLYGIKREDNSTKTLDGLFIRGNFPTFDFTNLIITNSGFSGYRKLLSSKFGNTKFMFTKFEHCASPSTSPNTLQPSMIDKSCDPGDLAEVFATWESNRQEQIDMILGEVKKFLNSFFKGDRFVDAKPQHIRFSSKINGLAQEKFNRLISKGYFIKSAEKTIATFYEISSDFQPSVRKFLADGYPDAKLKEFISTIKD